MTIPGWNKNTLIFGGAAAWGLLLISCMTVNRTIVAPPQIAGATFVGSSECATCHDDVSSKFHGSAHASLMAPGDNAINMGCESCHGPGSLHVNAGGGAGTIINPNKSPETCFQCHADQRGQFNLPNSHPVASGQMTCSDCHDPHGNPLPEGGTQMVALNESCVRCHNQQAGPYVFEHEATRDGCTACHSPHGSVNQKMLRARNSNLCMQCHTQQQTAPGQVMIGGRDHASFVSRGACWSAGCHEAVHGSHVNRSLRF